MRDSYGAPTILLAPGTLQVPCRPITSSLMVAVGVPMELLFLVLLISKVSFWVTLILCLAA